MIVSDLIMALSTAPSNAKVYVTFAGEDEHVANHVAWDGHSVHICDNGSDTSPNETVLFDGDAS